MTIPKRNKRGRVSNKLPPPLPPEEILDKDIPSPVMDKMVRNYPRICPFCRTQGFSSYCRCGRLTVINK